VVGSATDYSTTVLTGSRTDIKLEANKEGGSLLDLFITWKLPNFGMGSTDEATQVTQAAQAPVTESLASPEATGDKRTPSQIALDNLKNRK
jgi:hypothetical protein